MIRAKYIIVALSLVVVLATSGWSQIVFGQTAYGGTRIVYSHWTMETETGLESSLSQFYMPVTGMVPLKDNLEMQIYMATVSNNLESPLADVSLNGLTDLSVQVNQSLLEDRVLISGGMNLPVGKTKMTLSGDEAEWLVMEALSADFLNLPSRKLGAGFGFNLLVGGATKTGNINLGGTLSYQLSAPYEPYETAGDYNPGDAFAANVSAEMTSDKTAVSASVRMTTYGTDTRDDIKVLKQSAQVDLSIGATMMLGKASIEGGIRYLARGRNTVYDADEAILTQLKHFGNELDIYGRYVWSPAEKWTIAPTAGIMLLEDNELDFGSASIFDIGVGIGRQVSDNVDFGAGFRLFTGNALGDQLDLSGYQFSLSLTASL